MTHAQVRQLKREWAKALKMRPWDAVFEMLRIRKLAKEHGVRLK